MKFNGKTDLQMYLLLSTYHFDWKTLPTYQVNVYFPDKRINYAHKFCNMFSLLTELTMQKEYKILWQIMCFGQKGKDTTKHKIKHNKPCQSRDLNPGPLAPKADAWPLHHQVNWKYQLLLSYLTKQWVKM